MRRWIKWYDRLAFRPDACYFGYFVAATILAAVLRLIETVHLYLRFKPEQLLISEVVGFIGDAFIVGLTLVCVYPVHRLLMRRWPGLSRKIGWYFIGLFAFLHITISEYFFYQQRPLDVFLFKHRPEEMAFSISTADSNVLLPALSKYAIVLLIFLALVAKLYRWMPDLAVRKLVLGSFALVAFVAIPCLSIFQLPVSGNLAINKSTYFYVNVLREVKRVLVGAPLKQQAHSFQLEFPGPEYLDPDYPFLHCFHSDGNLAAKLPLQNGARPNVLLIIVEGLGNDFLQPVKGIHFMPFLDSLANKSLYWNHCLSTSERSFGATPSLNGSLPFGNDGFALMDRYPYHFSLVGVLNANDFQTRFFYGQGAWFHGKENFYRFNNIAQIIDREDYHPSFKKVFVGEEKFFWGYNDRDLFRQYFLSTPQHNRNPRYDVFFTGTSHAPFAVDFETYYRNKFRLALDGVQNEDDRQHFVQYGKYYTSLYNVDDALRELLHRYSSREDYSNTVFIITGDHPITEIPVSNPLKKYHVPLIIYSPVLERPQRFAEVCTHLDLYETMISLLQIRSGLQAPEYSTALSEGLRFRQDFYTERTIPLMTDNRRIDDFFYNGILISEGNRMYRVRENFELDAFYDNLAYQKIYRKLECYRAASILATENDQLLPTELYDRYFHYVERLNRKQISQFHLTEEGIAIASKVPVSAGMCYIDIELERWNFLSYRPECRIVVSDGLSGKVLVDLAESRKGNSVMQFHLGVRIPANSNKEHLMEVRIRDADAGWAILKSTKLRIYQEAPDGWLPVETTGNQ